MNLASLVLRFAFLSTCEVYFLSSLVIVEIQVLKHYQLVNLCSNLHVVIFPARLERALRLLMMRGCWLPRVGFVYAVGSQRLHYSYLYYVLTSDPSLPLHLQLFL